jgi:hypothetical protein
MLDVHGGIVDMVDQISNQRRECPIVAQVATQHRIRLIPRFANGMDGSLVTELGKRLARLGGTSPEAFTLARRFGDFLEHGNSARACHGSGLSNDVVTVLVADGLEGVVR